MSRAFVFGGGGKWGAVQVGMLHALFAHGLRPDLVVGCSIGSVNGACVAADPTSAGVDRLERLWVEQAAALEIRARLRDRIRSFVGRRPYLYEPEAIRAMAVSALWMLLLGALAIGLLAVVAWLSARTAVYTITDKRIVLRVGIVLTLTFNLPFKRIAAAGLRLEADGTGEIPLTLRPGDRIAYLHLWPHARPWHLARPEPMLRSVPEAQTVARLLAEAWSRETGLVATPADADAQAHRGSEPALAGR